MAEGTSKFIKETKSEMKKVVWPTREQLIKNTAVVIGTVIFLGIFIWVADPLLAWAQINILRR